MLGSVWVNILHGLKVAHLIWSTIWLVHYLRTSTNDYDHRKYLTPIKGILVHLSYFLLMSICLHTPETISILARDRKRRRASLCILQRGQLTTHQGLGQIEVIYKGAPKKGLCPFFRSFIAI